MTDAPLRSRELDDLYRQIADAPAGSARLPLLGRAIQLAQEAADEHSLYELRSALVGSAHTAGDAETAVAAFSWVLQTHLSDPTRFGLSTDQPVDTNVAWTFKWVIHSLIRNSAIGRNEIEASLAAMDDLYRRHGLGPSAPHYLRLGAAEYLGEVERLPELIELAEATPRDEYSDCAACVPHWLVSADLMLGDVDHAVERARALLASGRGCLSEPHATLADLLVPLIRLGDRDTVTDYVRRCLDRRGWGTEPERLSCAAELLAAAAVTDNVALGLDLLERHLPDLGAVVHDHVARLGFLSGAVLVLRRADRGGLGERPVRDTAGVVERQDLGRATTVAALADGFLAEAERLAEAFAVRAGNDWWRQWLARRWELDTVELPVDLGYPVSTTLVREPDPDPVTASGWLELAREREWVDDVGQALRAVETALRTGDLTDVETSEALSLRMHLRAVLAQEAAGVMTVAEVTEETLESAREAMAEYRAELLRQRQTDRLRVFDEFGLARHDLDWSPASDLLLDALRRLGEAGTPASDLAGLRLDAVRALLREGRLDEARELLTSVRGELLLDAPPWREPSTRLSLASVLAYLNDPDAKSEARLVLADPHCTRALRAPAMTMLARLHGGAGEFAAGAVAARDAADLYWELGADGRAVEARHLEALLLEDAGDLPGAIAATRRRLHLGESLETFDDCSARLHLGRLLVRAGQPDQAVVVLGDVDRLLLQRPTGEDPSLAHECAFWLGSALHDLDDPDGAAAVWESALRSADGRDPNAVLTIGKALGDLFAGYSMWDEAVEVFRTVRAAAEGEELPFEVARCNERIGLIRCFAGDSDGLADVDAAIDTAHAEDLPGVVAHWTESRARAANALGRTDQAVADALAASDLFLAVDSRSDWAAATELAARILAENGRAPDAVALLTPIVADTDDPELDELRRLLDELLS